VGRARRAHHHFGQRGGDIAAVFLRDAVGERQSDQVFGIEADKFEEGPVAFGDIALQVEQHDTHRRFVEQPMQTDFRAHPAIIAIAPPC